jgi:hypothetical protein
MAPPSTAPTPYWRLNRIPLLKEDLLAPAPSPLVSSNSIRTKVFPGEPADHGFVFSKDQVERCAQRMMRQNQSRRIAYARFEMPYRPVPAPSQRVHDINMESMRECTKN